MKEIEFARKIIQELESKKGEEILLLDVAEISSFTDFFILCNGSSSRMLSSLVDSVVEVCAKNDRKNRKVEGNAQTGWIVVDTGDTVVHLFSTDQREYYSLEELWAGGKVLVRLT